MKREEEKNFISDMREQILQALGILKLQNFKPWIYFPQCRSNVETLKHS